MADTTISILGCGWLGFPLGVSLTKAGYCVKGSSTTPEKLHNLKANNMMPYLIKYDPLGQGQSLDEFFSADILIVNIPPSTRSKPVHYHPNQIMNIRDQALKQGLKKIIYVSSTSVYPDLNGNVTEDTPPDTSTRRGFAAATAEKIIRHPGITTTVVRFGGLTGYDRNPGKYLAYLTAEKTDVSSRRKHPSTPVNYIHRDDAIGLLTGIIEKGVWNEVFNAVAPIHPTRGEIVSAQTRHTGSISDSRWDSSFKVVIGDKLVKRLNYTFRYPDPLSFYYE